MTVLVKRATREEIEQIVLVEDIPTTHVEIFFKYFNQTQLYWIGLHDNEVVCLWGLINPCLASDQAYLWLYTTPGLAGNEFVFVRHSQRAVQEMLKHYPVIVGHATRGAKRSIRWLRWLGAVFAESENGLIPFTIRAKHG